MPLDGRKMLAEGSIKIERQGLTSTLKKVQGQKRLDLMKRRNSIIKKIGLDKPISPWEVLSKDVKGFWDPEQKSGPVIHKTRGGKILGTPEVLGTSTRQSTVSAVKKFLAREEAQPLTTPVREPAPLSKMTQKLPKTEGVKTILEQKPWREMFWKLQTRANKAKVPEEYLKQQLRRYLADPEVFASKKGFGAQVKWFKNYAGTVSKMLKGKGGKLGIAAILGGGAYELLKGAEDVEAGGVTDIGKYTVLKKLRAKAADNIWKAPADSPAAKVFSQLYNKMWKETKPPPDAIKGTSEGLKAGLAGLKRADFTKAGVDSKEAEAFKALSGKEQGDVIKALAFDSPGLAKQLAKVLGYAGPVGVLATTMPEEASAGRKQLTEGAPRPRPEPSSSLPPESAGKRMLLSGGSEEEILAEAKHIPEWTDEELEEYGEIVKAAPPSMQEWISTVMGMPSLGKMPLTPGDWARPNKLRDFYRDVKYNPEDMKTTTKTALSAPFWFGGGWLPGLGYEAGVAMAEGSEAGSLGMGAVLLAGLAKRYKVPLRHPFFKAGEAFGSGVYKVSGLKKLRGRMQPKTYVEKFKKDPLRWAGKQLGFSNLDLPVRQIFRKRFAAMGIDQKTATNLYKITTLGLNTQQKLLVGEFMTKGWFPVRSFLKAHKGGGRVYRERVGHMLDKAIRPGSLSVPMREAPMSMSELYHMAKAAGMKPKQILRAYERSVQARKLMAEAGKKAVDNGLLENAIYRANLEIYIPFVYKNKALKELIAPDLAHVFTKMTYKDRLYLNRFIKRINMKPADYDKLGLVLEPAGPIMKGYAQVLRDVETAKMFSKLAHYGSASSSKKSLKFSTRIPNTPKFGAMRNRYTTPAISNELKGYQRETGAIENFFNKALSPWKVGKVILSPTTHMRNIVSNTILADLSGLPPWRIDVYAGAMKSLIGKDKWYKEAIEQGLLDTTWYGQEVYRGLGPITGRSMWDWILRGTGGGVGAWVGGKVGSELGGPAGGVGGAIAGGLTGWKFTKYAGSLYQAEEQFFKLAKYKHNIQSFGMTKNAAARDAEKALFNYGEAPPALRAARTYLHPFATFSYKAIPQVAEMAVKHPIRFGKYLVGFAAVQQQALASLNINQEEWEHIQRVLPDHIKKGNYLLLPYRDSKGKLQMMDWTYILPWGDISEMQQRGILGKLVANPFLTMPMEIKMNRNALGMPIWYDWNSPQAKAAKLMRYMGMQLMPSLTPGIGYNWEHLNRSFQGQKDALSKKQALAASFLGVKIRPIDVQERGRKTKSKVQRQRGEITMEARRKISRGMSREQAGRERREDIARLRERYR